MRLWLLIFWIFWALCLIHQSIYAEEIKVMVVDSGVSLEWPSLKSHVKESWSWDYVPNHWHGTAVASLVIKDTCEQVTLISCNYYLKYPNGTSGTNNCFKTAIKKNIDYMNYSSTGDEPNLEEFQLLKKLSDKGVIITVAAGNEGKNLTPSQPCTGSFPACYILDNLFPVQNINNFGYLMETSNYLKVPNTRSTVGSHIEVLLPNDKRGKVSGTSFSSAIYMNSLLKKRCWEMNK